MKQSIMDKKVKIAMMELTSFIPTEKKILKYFDSIEDISLRYAEYILERGKGDTARDIGEALINAVNEKIQQLQES